MHSWKQYGSQNIASSTSFRSLRAIEEGNLKKESREKKPSPGPQPFNAVLLGPGHANRLADQQGWIRSLSWHEFLWASAPHFRRVQVALLIHAELVRSPQSAGLGRHGAPGIEQLPVQVVLVKFEVAVSVRHPQVLVGGHEDMIRRGGSVAQVPLVEEFSILIEDLNAPVAAVVDVQPALVVNGDAVHGIEIIWP